MTDAPCTPITDLVSAVEQALEKQLRDLIHGLQHQENRTEEDIIKVLPQARHLLISKFLSRTLCLSCTLEMNAETAQAMTLLLSVVGQLVQSSAQASSPPMTSVERQAQAFQQKTAEFSKTIAKKEKIIADQIAQSQKHIAGLQRKMAGQR